MAAIKAGDTVFIHYTGTLTDGTEFDSSAGRDTLEFVVGSGMVIKGMDDGMTGMEVGEKKRLEIPAEDAYGPINPDNRIAVPRSQLPEDIPAEKGLMLQMQGPDGQAVPVTIVEVSDEEITLDANHALAGKDLIFDIEVVSTGQDRQRQDRSQPRGRRRGWRLRGRCRRGRRFPFQGCWRHFRCKVAGTCSEMQDQAG